jgi:hypothetical protein
MAAIASTPSPTWITPKEAAEALGVSERSVYNMCSEAKLGYEVQRVKGRKPFRMVNAADVESMIGSQVRPMLVTSTEPREKPTAVGPHVPPDAAAMQHFLAGILQAFPIQRPKPFLSLEAAAEYSGLPAIALKRLIREKRLPSLRMAKGERFVKRADLDALAL